VKPKSIHCVYIWLLVALCSINTIACRDSQSGFTETNSIFWRGEAIPHKLYNDAIAAQTHVVWSSSNHVSTAVPVGSIGPTRFSRKLRGIIKNTDIARTMDDAIANGVSVILLIGDGFGPSHLSLHSLVDIAQGGKNACAFQTILKKGDFGLCHTYTHAEFVTDSAAAATAIASGHKTNIGTIGIAPHGTLLESVAIKAKKNGFKVGIVTDTRITHATPAGFYGHVKSRDEENTLAEQLCDAGFDVYLGGGASHFIPQGISASQHPLLRDIAIDGASKRFDGADLVSKMKRAGYHIVAHKKSLMRSRAVDKLLGIFAAGNMNSRIDRDDENTGEPSLVEMTNTAIAVLSKQSRGFFLMIECGKLDYDSHENDLGAAIAALNEMETVLAACLRYYRTNPEKTLCLFTGDHETGASGFSYYETLRNEMSKDSKSTAGIASPKMEILRSFLNQKKSIRSIFADATSPTDLQQKLHKNLPFHISREAAKNIFQAIERTKNQP
jgi:alkaline phosphatase